jgi:hypothetical protein
VFGKWDWVAWIREIEYRRCYFQFGRKGERDEKLTELQAWVTSHALPGEAFFLELLHLPGTEIQNHKRVKIAKAYWETIEIKR